MVRIRHLALWATGPVLIGVAVTAAPPAGAAVTRPIVVDRCAGTVQGSPAQRVALRPAAVLQPVTDALAPLDPLGVLRWQLTATWNTLPPIPIGTVSADPASISGTAIGDSVVSKLGSVPALSPVLGLLSEPVGATLTDRCGIATKSGPQKWSPAAKPVAGPTGSRTSAPSTGAPRTSAPSTSAWQTLAPAGSPQSQMGAGNGVPGPGVPPDGVTTLSNQPLPPYNLPGVSPEGVITLSNQPIPSYSLPGLPSQSGVTPGNVASPQPRQGSVAGDTGRAHLLSAVEVTSNKRRLLPAFAVLLLALVLSQIVRSRALRSSRRPRQGAHVAPGGSPESHTSRTPDP